ncbi:hypothetical protein [Lacticaseibacillus mingshuiensis]|uniref:Uncharacterized protein n=1 Tax=Lacticaseibacillus mingshuiensis TaxID=2799574 RepID=A0ABW4CDD2_9LACO|nr:hypothetical protein [Lacticaseibacillus mingshuiensis]
MKYIDQFSLGLGVLLEPIDSKVLESLYKNAPKKTKGTSAVIRNQKQKKRIISLLITTLKNPNLQYLFENVKNGRLDNFYTRFFKFSDVDNQNVDYFLASLKQKSPSAGAWLLYRIKNEDNDIITKIFDKDFIEQTKWIDQWYQIEWNSLHGSVSQNSTGASNSEYEKLKVEIRRLTRANEKLKSKEEQQEIRNIETIKKLKKEADFELAQAKSKMGSIYEERLKTEKQKLSKEQSSITVEFNKRLDKLKTLQADAERYTEEIQSLNIKVSILEKQNNKYHSDTNANQTDLGMELPSAITALLEQICLQLDKPITAYVTDHSEMPDQQGIFLGRGLSVEVVANLIQLIRPDKVFLIQEEINTQFQYLLRRLLKHKAVTTSVLIVSKNHYLYK